MATTRHLIDSSVRGFSRCLDKEDSVVCGCIMMECSANHHHSSSRATQMSPRCLMVMTSDFYTGAHLEVAGSNPAGGWQFFTEPIY